MKPEILDRRYNKAKKNRHEFRVRCPGCDEERWTPSSNYAQSRTGLCSRCQLKEQYLPLGIKWKGRLTPLRIVEHMNGRCVYEFLCDCGNTITSEAHSCIRSCGCARRCKRKCKVSDHDLGIGQFYRQYKCSAKRRKKEFSLSLKEFEKLVESPCAYSGDPPILRKLHCRHRVVVISLNGIDRIDNTKGYTPDNVVPCSPICNTAKSDMPQADFIAWIKQTAAHVSKITV